LLLKCVRSIDRYKQRDFLPTRRMVSKLILLIGRHAEE
jgi:hypothetical protein